MVELNGHQAEVEGDAVWPDCDAQCSPVTPSKKSVAHTNSDTNVGSLLTVGSVPTIL